MTPPVRPELPALTPPVANEYDALLVENAGAARSQLQQAAVAAQKALPPAPQMARVLPIAQRTKLPAAVVARNLDVLEQATTREATDYDAIVRDTPGLAEWLQHPENAALGAHELGALGRVERGSRLLAGGQAQPAAPVSDDELARAGFIAGAQAGGMSPLLARILAPVAAPATRATSTGFSDLEASAGQLAAAFGLADPAAAARAVADANRRAAELRAGAPGYVQAYDQAMEAHHAAAARRNGILQVLTAASPQASEAAAVGSTVADLLEQLGLFASHPRAAAYRAVEGLPSFAPALASATGGAEAGAGVGTLVGGPAGATVGGAVGLAGGTFLGMAPVTVGAEINAELQRRGIDVTDAAALEQAYRDPTLMAAIRAKAERKGLTVAGVNALVAPFAGRFATAARVSGGGALRVAGGVAADLGVQTGGQVAGELAGQGAGGEPLDVTRALQAGIESLGMAVGMEAAGASLRTRHAPDVAQAALEVHQRATEAIRAQRDAQALAEVGAAVQEAPTTASVPERVQQLVAMATGGEDAANVYFQSGDWDSYWQARGESPATKAAELLGDGGRAYDEAKATGAPIAVPLADYVAKVAPTEHFDGLLPVARTTPDGMSLGEAHEYLQSLPATLADLSKEATAAAEAPATTPLEQSAQRVGEDVRAQLEAAGRTKSEAKAGAALYEAAFRTLGERTGIDPKALYDRYQLTIGKGDEASAAQSAERIAAQDEAVQALQEGFAGGARAEEPAPTSLDQPALAEPVSLTKHTSFSLPLKESGRDTPIHQLTIATPKGDVLVDLIEHGRGAPLEISLIQLASDDPANQLGPAMIRQVGGLLKREFPEASGIEGVRISGASVRAGVRGRVAEYHQPAYHGSPHEFEKFSLHAIGTGEGAQAFGWGLYFAGKKEIAQWYREKLAGAVGRFSALSAEEDAAIPEWAKKAIVEPDRTGARDAAGAIDHLLRDFSTRPNSEGAVAALRKLKAAGSYEQTKPGRLYHVEIPEDDTMLHWDKPMSEQPPAVRAAVEKLDLPMIARWKESGAWEHVDGRDLYMAMSEHLHLTRADFNAAENTSRAMADLGITGIKYLDGASRAKGEGAHNYVIFDDQMVQILEYEQRSPTTGIRGRIRFEPDGRTAIDLFKAADRSTFFHETAHFYMHVLEDLASAKDAPAEFLADHATLRDWLGAEAGAPLTRGQQEQFARGFEAYLMEGKAPSVALKRVFFQAKQWLLRVYRSVRALNVELTDPVRAVFDRLLASEAAIREAEATQHATPLFGDPKAVGLTEEQAVRYQEAVQAAHREAEEAMTAELMRDLRREDSAEWKRLRAPIEQEVQAQVAGDKVYRAITELTASFKIDRAAAKQLLGDTYRQLPSKYTAAEAGVPPDVAAEMLGFRSGRELLVALAHAPSEKAMVKLLTDERMRAEYGERTTDAEIEAHARADVLSEQRVQLLRREIEILASQDFTAFKGLTRAIARALPPDQAVKAEAARMIGAKPVKEIQPHLFALAAARHAKAAREAFLKGDLPEALRLKHQELLVTELHRSATEARAEVTRALESFKAVYKADATLAKRRDMDLVNAARAILSAFGIGKSERPPASYLEQIRKYEPDTYEFLAPLIEQATATAASVDSWKALRYDDFTALRDAVDGLWALSRRTKQIEIDGQLVEREQVHGELAQRLEAFAKPGVRAGYAKAATAWEKTKMALLGVRAALRRTEAWADAMDAGDPSGVFRKYVWNPVSEGATQYRLAKREAMAKYLEIVHAVEPALTTTPIEAPELGYTFANKGELLGALLHSGNESNLSKLLRGRGWGTVDENGVLDRSRWNAMVRRLQTDGTLTKIDYDYLQGVWDLFDDLKAGAQRAHKAMYGHYFSEITAEPFTTPFGDYRGGYVPAKADPFMTPDAAIREERSALEGNNNSFSFPTTGRGFTKARVEAYAAPLVIDARMVPSHIDGVLRFTHIEPRVKDVARVLHDRELVGALDRVDPTVRGDMLVPWLQRAATQKVDTPSGTGWGAKAMDGFARELRRRSGMQIIALNVVNSLQQLTGISISAVKVKPAHLASALWQYVRAPRETAAAIAERSDYMRARETSAVAEIQQTIDELMLDPSTYDQARTFAAKHGHFLTAATQNVVDTITWTGAYNEAVAAGRSEKEAVRLADSAIRETQGSGAPEDISRFETGTPFHRLFSMFTGYFNMQANLLGTEFATTARQMGLRKGAGRLLYVYALGFMLPAVLSDQIMNMAGGRPFDEDDDGPADDALALFFGSQFSGAMRMLPVVGPVADFTVRNVVRNNPDDRVATSAAIATLERAATAPADVYKSIRDRQVTTKEIRDVLTALGLLTGLPVAPFAKPIGYLNDVRTGRAQPSGPVDVTRGLMSGRPGAP